MQGIFSFLYLSYPFTYRHQPLASLALIYQKKIDVKGKTETEVGSAFQPIFTFICYYEKTVIKYSAA